MQIWVVMVVCNYCQCGREVVVGVMFGYCDVVMVDVLCVGMVGYVVQCGVYIFGCGRKGCGGCQ